MLNQIDLSKKTPKGTYAKQFDKKSAELGYLGRALRDAKVPVIILLRDSVGLIGESSSTRSSAPLIRADSGCIPRQRRRSGRR
ncbi:hypothetical protein M5E89_10180 [Acidaminococcus intestini]|nr:hypothetical protein M5E89_10180 [Acidaminococcus intestini]